MQAPDDEYILLLLLLLLLLWNTNIHRLTSQSRYELRIDLEDFNGSTRYAVYKTFSLTSEQDHFRLNVGEYSGNAGTILE